MPLFLLANWKWLLGAFATVVLGVMLGFAHIKIADLERDAAQTATRVEAQKKDAQRQIAESEKHARELVEKNLALNIQLEKANAEAQAKGDKLLDDNRKLAARIGELLNAPQNRCGSSGSDHVPAESNPASGGPSTAASSRLSEALGRLIAGGNKLLRESDGTADVGIACHNFVMEPQ